MAIGTRLRPTIPSIEIKHFIWNNFYHIHWMFVSIYFVHNLCYVLLGTLGVHLCSLPCVLKVTTPPLTRTDKIFEFNKEHWLRTISIYKNHTSRYTCDLITECFQQLLENHIIWPICYATYHLSQATGGFWVLDSYVNLEP